MKFPKHKAEMIITHNEHKTDYMDLEKYLNSIRQIRAQISPENLQKCIDSDSYWEIQIYTRTPISSVLFAGPTWDAMMEEVNKYFTEEEMEEF